MEDRDFFKQQKDMLADLFNQAQAYTNLVIVTGYAGAFAIWNFLSDKLSPATGLCVGLLLCISLGTYIAWELYGMLQKRISMMALIKSVDNFGRYSAEVEAYQDRNQLVLRRFERYWPVTMIVAAGSAALAMILLISAFCHGLLLQLLPKISVGRFNMDVMAMFVALGGLVAGLIGIASFRLESKQGHKRGQKRFSSAIQEELRTSIELFKRLMTAWEEEGYIDFIILDEIDFSRATFLGDRSSLQLFNDSDMRQRIANYYRESAVTLQRLRNNQADYYQVDSVVVGEEEAQKKREMLTLRKQWIEDGLERLKMHQIQADQVASQLYIRY